MKNNKMKLNNDAYGLTNESSSVEGDVSSGSVQMEQQITESMNKRGRGFGSKKRNFKPRNENKATINSTTDSTPKTRLVSNDADILVPSTATFPNLTTGSITFYSVMKNSFRVYDNHCFNSRLLNGYFEEVIRRYISDRGLQLEGENSYFSSIESILDDINQLRNLSFEAYAILLTLARKYSCTYLADNSGSKDLGKAFSNDFTGIKTNLPIEIDIQDEHYYFLDFDYGNVRLSPATWAQDYQSLFQDFYLTPSAISYCEDLFKDYILVKQIGVLSIYLDNYPEYSVGSHLDRLNELHNYARIILANKPYMRGLMESLGYILMVDTAYSVTFDKSRTTLYRKVDDGTFANSLFNVPYCWLTSFDPGIPWDPSPGYVPDPYYTAFLGKEGGGSDQYQQVIDTSRELARVLLVDNVAKAQPKTCIDPFTYAFNEFRKTSNKDYYKRRLQGLIVNDCFYNKDTVAAIKAVQAELDKLTSLDIVSSTQVPHNSGGLMIPGFQLVARGAQAAGQLVRRAPDPEFFGELNENVETWISFGNQAANWVNAFRKSTKELKRTRPEEERTQAPRESGETDKQYIQRIGTDFTYRPTAVDPGGVFTYSMKYIRDLNMNPVNQIVHFDTSITLNEFAIMDRFRMMRPTTNCTVVFSNFTPNYNLERQYFPFKVCVKGGWLGDNQPESVGDARIFTRTQINVAKVASLNMFAGIYGFSARGKATIIPDELRFRNNYIAEFAEKKFSGEETPPADIARCIAQYRIFVTKVQDSTDDKIVNTFLTEAKKWLGTGDDSCRYKFDQYNNDFRRIANDTNELIDWVDKAVSGGQGIDRFGFEYIASCAVPGREAEGTKIQTLEDRNTVSVKEYQFYRELCKIEVFHPDIALTLRNRLSSAGSIAMRVLRN